MSSNMPGRLILYDRATDRMADFIDVPDGHLAAVLGIAGVTNASALGEHSLTREQIEAIASLIGFSPDTARFHYHIEPRRG